MLYEVETGKWYRCRAMGWAEMADCTFIDWLAETRRLVTELELTSFELESDKSEDELLNDYFSPGMFINRFEAGLTPEQTAYLIQSEGI